jgi:hypothetical protein
MILKHLKIIESFKHFFKQEYLQIFLKQQSFMPRLIQSSQKIYKMKVKNRRRMHWFELNDKLNFVWEIDEPKNIKLYSPQ